VATKTKRQSYRKAGRGGGRITGGRTKRGGGRSAKPGGPMGLLNQITGQVGGRGGRGASKGASKGGGLATKAGSFVSGFLGGGGKSGRRRR
jgi:hypothetical protein